MDPIGRMIWGIIIAVIIGLTLVRECYAMKLELHTNVTVVDDAIR